MLTLNKDCLHTIAYQLNYSDISNLSISCKQLKKVFSDRYFWNNKFQKDFYLSLDLNKNPKKYYYYFKSDKPIVAACRNGDLEVLNYLYHLNLHNFNTNMVEAYVEADKNGYLDVVKFLFSIVGKEISNFLILTVGLGNSIRRSDVKMVKYYLSQGKSQGIKVKANMIFLAAQYRNLEIVQLLLKNYQTGYFNFFKTRKEAAQIAKRYKNFEIAAQLEGNYHYQFVFLLFILVLSYFYLNP